MEFTRNDLKEQITALEQASADLYDSDLLADAAEYLRNYLLADEAGTGMGLMETHELANRFNNVNIRGAEGARRSGMAGRNAQRMAVNKSGGLSPINEFDRMVVETTQTIFNELRNGTFRLVETRNVNAMMRNDLDLIDGILQGIQLGELGNPTTTPTQYNPQFLSENTGAGTNRGTGGVNENVELTRSGKPRMRPASQASQSGTSGIMEAPGDPVKGDIVGYNPDGGKKLGHVEYTERGSDGSMVFYVNLEPEYRARFNAPVHGFKKSDLRVIDFLGRGTTKDGKVTKTGNVPPLPQMLEMLQNGVWKVVFKKKGNVKTGEGVGEIRSMLVTNDPTIAPKYISKTGKKRAPIDPKNENAFVSVWSIDNEGWRGFIYSSVIDFEKSSLHDPMAAESTQFENEFNDEFNVDGPNWNEMTPAQRAIIELEEEGNLIPETGLVAEDEHTPVGPYVVGIEANYFDGRSRRGYVSGGADNASIVFDPSDATLVREDLASLVFQGVMQGLEEGGIVNNYANFYSGITAGRSRARTGGTFMRCREGAGEDIETIKLWIQPVDNEGYAGQKGRFPRPARSSENESVSNPMTRGLPKARMMENGQFTHRKPVGTSQIKTGRPTVNDYVSQIREHGNYFGRERIVTEGEMFDAINEAAGIVTA